MHKPTRVATRAVHDPERVAGLEKTLEQWVAEYAEARHTDPVRAHHVAEAISDLRALIAQVEAGAFATADGRAREQSPDFSRPITTADGSKDW